MRGVRTVIGYALRESLRRKVFTVVLVLTALFLALYALGTRQVFRDVQGFAGGVAPAAVDVNTLAAATVFGLAMFATLFLGVVLAIFLTLGVVRGDAERGLLQPLVVRPLGRSTLLLARFLGAVGVCAPYVLGVYFASMVITGLTGHYWPDRIVRPGLELAAAVAIVAALSLLGSVFLSSTANGIAIFMVFGAGLVAGLLGTIGHALASHTLERAAKIATYVIPVEALYQDALQGITADQRGLTKFVLELGPFGGAYTGGVGPRVWAAIYLCLVAVAAVVGFSRRDL